MRNIAELTVLLRTRVELKSSLKPKTAEPREIWNFFTGMQARLTRKYKRAGGISSRFLRVPEEHVGGR
jgi:hypothetical protein